jgi:multiple sugar transport system ATP-binding protein
VTGANAGRRVAVGVRPENILEAGAEARGETAPLTADVEIVEPLGHEVIVHGRVGDDLLVAKLDPHHVPRLGDKVNLVIELNSLHLFDAETEQRLG